MAAGIDEQVRRLTRGTVEIVPERGLRAKLELAAGQGRPLRVKLGMDPNVPDLHLGHSIVLRKLRQFQDYGHEVQLVIGTFTAMIGDPSGRSETRKQTTAEETLVNAGTYVAQYGQILDPERTRVYLNHEWLAPLTFADVIRLTAKTTVARLLERDDFSKRYGEGLPIGVHELMYPICQAYDSVHLRSDIEMGGTDQRFNILMGRELQREYGQEPQLALFMPLLVGLDGHLKMSKSLANYVGLHEPAGEMFSKLLSISDSVLEGYYEYLTEFSMDVARTLIESQPMESKKQLAGMIVGQYRGEAAAVAARAEWESVHSRRELPEEIPAVVIPRAELDEQGTIWVVRLLQLCALVQGTNEARRAGADGGVRVDGERLSDTEARIAVRDDMVVQIGRRRFARVAVEA